jgi:hypothetical protein
MTKKEEKKKVITGTCKKCGYKFKIFYGIENTNIAFPVLTGRKLYENDEQLIGVCHNPKCPNYSLLQVI